MTRMGRRRFVISGTILVVVLLLATLVVVTDIGAPRERYTSQLDPCHLLDEQSVRELIGDTRLEPSFHPGSKIGLTREADGHICVSRARDASAGSLNVLVTQTYGTQFRLGRDGEERAADLFADVTEEFLDRYGADASLYEEHSERGSVSGMYDEPSGFRLHIQRANVFIAVSINPQDSLRGQSIAQPRDLLATLTDQVMSYLDEFS